MNKKTCFFLVLFLILFVNQLTGQRKPNIIAHRGFWQSAGAAQNSLASFKNAAEAEVYGSEFDVWMTKDSVLILYHDATIQGMVIDSIPYSYIQDFQLPNGEKIPTLREFLESARAFENIQLIFELKLNRNATTEWSRETARRSIELVREKKLLHRTEYISFNLDAAKEIIRLLPDAQVYYLNGELSPQELKDMGFAGLDYHYKVMQKNPQWFTEAKQLGLGINVWTVNDLNLMEEMIEMGADFITTDKPDDALKYISTHYRKQ